MSDICKQWYLDHKKAVEDNTHLFNEKNKEQFFKNVTGHGEQHCAWLYTRIHGAVMRMGGMANFSHYVNTCAEEDYKSFALLEKEVADLKRKLAMLENKK